MLTYRVPLTHRPERDGSSVTGAHVPYYLALEVVASAWGRFIDEESEGSLSHHDLAVVHVDFDFPGELLVGEVDVDVDVTRMGRSSLTLALAMHQLGTTAATGRTVVARVDEGRRSAVPFSPVQRAALQRHMQIEAPQV